MTGVVPARRPPGRVPVPVDRRWFGVDRRSLVPAGVVILLWLLWSVAVPHVNDAVAYEDEVRAGDQLALTSELVLTPAAGWDVLSGFRTTDIPAAGAGGPVQLSHGGVVLVVQTGEFSGSPDQLLDQVNTVAGATSEHDAFRVAGARSTVTTRSGQVGVAEGFTTPRSSGAIVAFVIDGVGVEVQVVGAPDQMSALSPVIARMVESIGPRTDGGATR